MFNEITDTKKLSKERLNSLLENILKSESLEETVMLDLIKLLREQGAILPKDEQTLRTVEKNGKFMVAWYLVENGAKIDFKLIMSALENYQSEFVNYLIDKEPKFVLQNDKILYTAIELGIEDIVKKILNLDIPKNNLNIWYLITAIKKHRDTVFDLLIEYFKKEELICNDYLLEIAIREEQDYMVAKLIDLGLYIKAKSLFNAISVESAVIVQRLLNKKEFSVDTISKALEQASNSVLVNTLIIKALLSKNHSRSAVKKSIKLIKKRRKEIRDSTYNKITDPALVMLRKDKNSI